MWNDLGRVARLQGRRGRSSRARGSSRWPESTITQYPHGCGCPDRSPEMVALAKAIKTAALREVAGELVTGLVALVRRA
jgi:hypothetical protein